ncbi:Com family DNA-binding transcriptional regulator [Pseudodesulfovibrio sp.]|uniref:Com family DNA-binding transcriptional regulator n=1 Tax=unclassified Pseudodesulfovibrio TaxID=2661612 RepID=UPI003B00C0D1
MHCLGFRDSQEEQAGVQTTPTVPAQTRRNTAPRTAATVRRDNPLLHSPDQGGKRLQGASLVSIKMRKTEIRCGHCNRLLGIGQAVDLQIKCPRCGTINHLIATSFNTESPRASTGELSEDSNRKRYHVSGRSSGVPEDIGRKHG